MGVMFKSKDKKDAATPTSVPAGADGRDRLRHLAGELAKANQHAVDVEARLDRLVGIIRDADRAHAALQDAVAADRAQALAEYAAGNASDAPIAKLIAAEETTAKAAPLPRLRSPGRRPC